MSRRHAIVGLAWLALTLCVTLPQELQPEDLMMIDYKHSKRLLNTHTRTPYADDGTFIISNAHSCNVTSACLPCTHTEQSSQASYCQPSGFREEVSCYVSNGDDTEDPETDHFVQTMQSCLSDSNEPWKVITFEICMMIGFFGSMYGVSIRSRMAMVAHYQRIQRRIGD